MATTLNIWTAVAILLGALTVLPSIMGLFGKNKFDVNGKVRSMQWYFPSLASLTSTDRPAHRCLRGHGQERRETISS